MPSLGILPAIRSSQLILQISITAAALICNSVAVLNGEQGRGFLAASGFAQMRRRLADRLNILAEAVKRKTSLPAEHLGFLVGWHLSEGEHCGEYAENTIARYEDLHSGLAAYRRDLGCRTANDNFLLHMTARQPKGQPGSLSDQYQLGIVDLAGGVVQNHD